MSSKMAYLPTIDFLFLVNFMLKTSTNLEYTSPLGVKKSLGLYK